MALFKVFDTAGNPVGEYPSHAKLLLALKRFEPDGSAWVEDEQGRRSLYLISSVGITHLSPHVVDVVQRELKQKLDCVEICLAAYSLKQMKKSGRVSAAAAVVGDLLGIRPIISLNAGVSKVESKVRGDAAVPAAMIKWVESRVDSMKDTPYMVAYTSSTAKRDELVKLCKKAFGHAPLIVFQLGGVVSANTGPDGIAIHVGPSPSRAPYRLLDVAAARALLRTLAGTKTA